MCENIVSNIKPAFELKENKSSKFLGMENFNNGMNLSQIEFIESLLVKYNLENCKALKTPIVTQEDKRFPLSDEPIDMITHQELIGELLYLANQTCPDISFEKLICHRLIINH